MSASNAKSIFSTILANMQKIKSEYLKVKDNLGKIKS
jgi:hypothetical protein